MNTYFDFIIYLAFEKVLVFEKRRSLSLTELHNFRLAITRKVQEFFTHFSEFDDQEFYQKVLYFLQTLEMTEKEEQDNFADFIHDNMGNFTYQNGAISLNSNISRNELEDAKFELPCYKTRHDQIICGTLIGQAPSSSCLAILNIHKVVDLVNETLQTESRVEAAYLDLPHINDNPEYKNASAQVNFVLSFLSRLPENKFFDFHITLHHNDTYPRDDLDSTDLVSDEIIEQDAFVSMYEEHITSLLENDYLRAIFEDCTLIFRKLGNILMAITYYRKPNSHLEVEFADTDDADESLEEWITEYEDYQDEYETDEDDDEEEEDLEDTDRVEEYLHQKEIDYAFYLRYIQKLDQILNMYGQDESLKKAKYRLLYLLDAYGENLYVESNLNQAQAKVKHPSLSKADLQDFYTISRTFLEDILNGYANDENLLRKLIFVSTYYDLSKSHIIDKIIHKYQNTEIGRQVKECLRHHNFSPFIPENDSPKFTVKNPNSN